MTTEDFIKNVAHDLFSSRVTLTPIAEAKAIPCNIIPKPAQVIFNPPATIVYWEDGDKTVVRCDNDVFSEEFVYAMACMRKAYGSRGEFKAQFKNAFRPYLKPNKKGKDKNKDASHTALPPKSKIIGLDQMIKQLAGDDSMGVCVGYRVKEDE